MFPQYHNSCNEKTEVTKFSSVLKFRCKPFRGIFLSRSVTREKLFRKQHIILLYHYKDLAVHLSAVTSHHAECQVPPHHFVNTGLYMNERVNRKKPLMYGVCSGAGLAAALGYTCILTITELKNMEISTTYSCQRDVEMSSNSNYLSQLQFLLNQKDFCTHKNL